MKQAKINKFLQEHGDNCSLCGKEFPHNSQCFIGKTKEKPLVIVCNADACYDQLKKVYGVSVYTHHLYGIETSPEAPPYTPEEALKAAFQMQTFIAHRDRVAKKSN